MEQRVKDIITNAYNKEMFSAAALTAHSKDWQTKDTIGTTMPESCNLGNRERVEPNTQFDLASLTKPLSTIMLVLLGMKHKLINPNHSIRKMFGPNLPSRPWDDITVLDLMRHTSGFAAWEPLFQTMPKDEYPKTWYLHTLLTTPKLLVEKPARVRIYSDLGYILLGFIIEKALTRSLHLAFEDMLAEFGIQTDLHFNLAGETPVFDKDRYAATLCTNSQLLQAIVHDDNARALGGVAGHAGLFGSITGINAFMEFFLMAANGETETLSRELFEFVSKIHTSKTGTKYTNGFDIPEGEQSTAGPNAPEDTIGHLGFTGTSFWISTSQRAFGILLTNRVVMDTPKEEINKLRAQFHSTVWPNTTRQ